MPPIGALNNPPSAFFTLVPVNGHCFSKFFANCKVVAHFFFHFTLDVRALLLNSSQVEEHYVTKVYKSKTGLFKLEFIC